MITLSIYKKMIKQCGDIRNLHKAVKTLWQFVEQKRVNHEQTKAKAIATKRKTKFRRRWFYENEIMSTF
jgi:hypothetical protein